MGLAAAHAPDRAQALMSAGEKGSNFFLGFLTLTRAKREALAAVYSYCRRIDDIVDSGELPQAEARRELEAWRQEVARLFAGSPTRPEAQRLLPHVAAF
ncbi:MAG: squalene/phytoene synthase family protein, partial [Elusimicrobiota bacterium]